MEHLDSAHVRGLLELAHQPDEASLSAGSAIHALWWKTKQQLQQAQREFELLSKQSGSNPADVSALRAEVSNLRDKLVAARAELIAADPDFFPASQIPSLTYADMQALLGPNRAAAVWIWSPAIAGVFLLAKDLTAPSFWPYTEAERKDIVDATNDFLRAAQLTKSDTAFHDAFAKLSRALRMRDVVDHMLRYNDNNKQTDAPHPNLRHSAGNNYYPTNCDQLVIVPHGFLQCVPFNSLPVRDYDTSLSDIYDGGVTFCPSLALLRLATQRLPGMARLTPDAILAVQNPTQDRPGADEEVQQLLTMLPGRVLRHGEATKSRVIEALRDLKPSPFALHLSCHSSYDFDSRWENALKLADGTALSVGDIIDLPLRNCHLCTLSACQTGLAELGSNEAVGLTSALLTAGVSRVVSSLWPVDNAATALLITRMYHELLTHDGALSVGGALRNAQVWLRGLSLDQAADALHLIDRSLALRLDATRGGVVLPMETIVVSTDFAARGAFQMDDGSTVTSAAAFAEQVRIDASSCAPASPDRAAGAAFTLADWQAFVAAHNAGKTTFIYSHLFPTTNNSPNTMMPERDYWFEYPKDDGSFERVVLHVHYLGTWAEQDETRIAQVNARFPSAGNHYQFVSHAKIQQGLDSTARMFRVTAYWTDPKRRYDPTKWMNGEDGAPRPWIWLSDPDRTKDLGGLNIKTVQHKHEIQPLKDVYREGEEAGTDVLRRFREVHDILRPVFEQITAKHTTVEFAFPVDTLIGGYDREMVPADLARDIKPYASPRFWASFIVNGDGMRVERGAAGAAGGGGGAGAAAAGGGARAAARAPGAAPP